jgi:hypothetical protein
MSGGKQPKKDVFEMWETFLAILTAHLIGDFVLQSNWMIAHKQQWWVLLIHVSIVSIITGLLLGSLNMTILLVIFFSHWVFDWIKIRIGDSTLPFVVDQLAHLTVAILLSLYLPDALSLGWWQNILATNANVYYASLCLISGGILSIPAGGILIGKVMKPLTDQISKEKLDGLKNGGKYIGLLERTLIYLFILMGSIEGVGFLLGAKSILRFGEIKDQEDRKVTEYIIIGTFFSFGWGILFAFVTQMALTKWPMQP